MPHVDRQFVAARTISFTAIRLLLERIRSRRMGASWKHTGLIPMSSARYQCASLLDWRQPGFAKDDNVTALCAGQDDILCSRGAQSGGVLRQRTALHEPLTPVFACVRSSIPMHSLFRPKLPCAR